MFASVSRTQPVLSSCNRRFLSQASRLRQQIFLTSGDSDLLAIIESPSGDNVAKFAIALGGMGNVRTRTARAWTEAEFVKLISELP